MTSICIFGKMVNFNEYRERESLKPIKTFRCIHKNGCEYKIEVTNAQYTRHSGNTRFITNLILQTLWHTMDECFRIREARTTEFQNTLQPLSIRREYVLQNIFRQN